MKTIQRLLFLALIYQFMPSALVAQPGRPTRSTTPETKPFIFSRLPQKFEISTKTLKNIFNLNLNDEISLPLPGGNAFNGKVSSKVQRDENVLSVNIISSNFPGTLLNISLITHSDKSEKMIGRFLNPRSGDVMLIEKENERYVISKDLQKYVMAECPLPPAPGTSSTN
ncbi:MAG: hypothetical protein EOO02_05600 [Chitinophagaceae bacterium]|nr:MAG: hypothetical protein EOO02_05600 [Chitinophagaceae bacterium]